MLNVKLSREQKKYYQMLCKSLKPRTDYISEGIRPEYKGKTQQDSSSKK